MKTIVRKLSSRKLWLALSGVATGLALMFGASAGELTAVAGAAAAVVSVVTYLVTEGRVDAAAVAGAVSAVEQAAREVGESDHGGD